jgi:hypothetical protein
MLSDKKKCAVYGRRGGLTRRDQVYCIEGEHVTMMELALKLGVPNAKAAYALLRRARDKGPVVTWASLGLKR